MANATCIFLLYTVTEKNTDNTKLQTAGKIITAINAKIKVVMQKSWNLHD